MKLQMLILIEVLQDHAGVNPSAAELWAALFMTYSAVAAEKVSLLTSRIADIRFHMPKEN